MNIFFQFSAKNALQIKNSSFSGNRSSIFVNNLLLGLNECYSPLAWIICEEWKGLFLIILIESKWRTLGTIVY